MLGLGLGLSNHPVKQRKWATANLFTSLVSHWKLDEASGTRSDSHGTNHLTDNATVGQAVGKIASAAHFIAANSEYLSIVDNASLSFADEDFTVAFWVYFDTDGIRQGVVTKGSASSPIEYVLFRHSDNVLYLALGNGLGQVVQPGVAIASGAWKFIVFWHDSVANTVNIQVDNGTITSVAYTFGCNNGASPFFLGAESPSGSPGFYLNGKMDSVSVWKRVLTATEKTAIYNGGSGLDYPF